VVFFSYQDRHTHDFFISKIGEDGNLDQPTIDALRQRARDKLDLVIRYAQTHRCRRQMILDYFGDEVEVADCQCDVCRRGDVTTPAAEVVIPDEVVVLVRQLLSAIARLRGKFGVGVVADVLAGSQNEKTTRWGLDQLSVFGLLKSQSTKRIVAMIHRLLESGLAQQRDPERKFMPIVDLTAVGVAVMKGEQPPPAPLIDLVPRPGTRADGTNPRALGTNPRASGTNPRARSQKVDEEVFDDAQIDPETLARFHRLRTVRLELARDRQLPPYCICHDRTLKLIALRSPTDSESLEQIRGMGPHKVRMYGERFIRALKESV
jgi:ATP-dependent DNA helicase RecQ